MKILTLAKFSKEADLEEIEDFEWIEIIIDISTVIAANKAADNLTTIELPSGFRQTVAIKWDKYKELINDIETIIDAKCNYEYQEQ